MGDRDLGSDKIELLRIDGAENSAVSVSDMLIELGRELVGVPNTFSDSRAGEPGGVSNTFSGSPRLPVEGVTTSRLENATEARSDGRVDDWKERLRYESSSIEVRRVNRFSIAADFMGGRPLGEGGVQSTPKSKGTEHYGRGGGGSPSQQ